MKQEENESSFGVPLSRRLDRSESVTFNVEQALEGHAQDLEYQMEQIRTSFGRDLLSIRREEDEYSYCEEEEYLSEDERAIYNDLEEVMSSIRSQDDLGKLVAQDTEETVTASFSDTSEEPSLGGDGDESSADVLEQIIRLYASPRSTDTEESLRVENSRRELNGYVERSGGRDRSVPMRASGGEEVEGNADVKQTDDISKANDTLAGESTIDPEELSILEHLEFLMESLRNLSPEEFLNEFAGDSELSGDAISSETKSAIICRLVCLLQSKVQDMYSQGEGLNMVYASSLLAARVHSQSNPFTSMLPFWFRHALRNLETGQKPKWALLPTVGSASADGRHFMPLCDSEEYHDEDPMLSDLEDIDET